MAKKIFLLMVTFMSIISRVTSQNSQPLSANWTVTSDGYLKVCGKTNLNSFNFMVDGYAQKDQLTIIDKKLVTGHIKTAGTLQFQIEDFDCGKRMMNKEMKKTLRSNQYPEMAIQFISIEKLPEMKRDKQALLLELEISLAGTKKRYQVLCSFTKIGRGLVQMTGEKNVLFSDFNLTPPSKIGGLVKAQNKLKVEFLFNLKPTGSEFL